MIAAGGVASSRRRRQILTMAIITTENDVITGNGHTYVWPPRRTMTHTRLVKENISRQGLTGWTKIVRTRCRRQDRQSDVQLAYRAVMKVWARLTNPQKYSWPDPKQKNFFAHNVPRVLAGLPIERTP